MRRGFPVLLAVAFACAAPLAWAEDWDFTPADYRALTQGGGDLGYEADSDWLPQEIRDNLGKTLKKVLDPATQPAHTAGVNTKDFYHGHVVCPKPCTEKQRVAIRTYLQGARAARIAGMGKDSPTITASNMAQWKQSIKAVQDLATALLRDCLVTGCGVVYHTFEASGPRMQPGDPRRNLHTPNGASGSPTGFTPPEVNNASSYSDNFCVVMQFAFLIDERGRIHATVDSTRELATVTGIPPPP